MDQPATIHDFLSPSETRELIVASDLRGWLAVGTSWAVIAAAMGAFIYWPSFGVGAIALVLIGGRQLGLAILMHDCAHRSLFATRWLNDWVGRWLCAVPLWHDLARYRVHHLKHHRDAGTPQDPDLDLVTAYPVSGSSFF